MSYNKSGIFRKCYLIQFLFKSLLLLMSEYKKVVYICKITPLHKVAKLMKKCLLFFQSQKNLVQKTLSSILYYFSTLLVAMIGSCKTLVLYTFAKTWFKLRDYLFFPGNDQVLLTEKQSADYYNSAKSSGTRVTTFKLAVEKFKLFTNAIFSMVRVIFSTILVIPTYILPHLVPSHIANLMSIAEATTTNQGKQTFFARF